MTDISMAKETHRVPIPKYTLGEELVSSISHGMGAAFGITALIICTAVSAMHANAMGVVCSVIFGSSLIILYCMSCIYHALKPCMGKRVLRVFDHCSIFLLIAGTYTPFTLISLKGPVGWTVFGIVWGAAIIGIVVNAIDLEKFKVISMITYLVMGWVIIFAFKPLMAAVDIRGIKLLLFGGVVYTVGAVIYGVGNKVKYMHSVWHFFVLGGSILHFFSIVLYVL